MNELTQQMNIKEFRTEGYLQELNRKFLHPLGLALVTSIDDNNEEHLSGIWDCRNDPDAIEYDIQNSSIERIAKFIEHKSNIDNQYTKYAGTRLKKYGSVVEPIPMDD